MLQAYVDDSGKGTPPVFVLGGWVAPADKWVCFSDEWQSVLDEHPRLAYFKMKEAAVCRGQFARWRFIDRDERLRRFVSIIQRSQAVPFCFAVRLSDYDKIFRNRVATAMNDPYVFLFYSVMHVLHRIQEHVGDIDPVDFIFDEQGKQIGQALAAWKFWKAFAPPEIAGLIGSPPISRSDTKTLPLQAADMLAWCVRREMIDDGRDRHPVLDLCKLGLIYRDIATRERLQAHMDHLIAFKAITGRSFKYDPG